MRENPFFCSLRLFVEFCDIKNFMIFCKKRKSRIYTRTHFPKKFQFFVKKLTKCMGIKSIVAYVNWLEKHYTLSNSFMEE